MWPLMAQRQSMKDPALASEDSAVSTNLSFQKTEGPTLASECPTLSTEGPHTDQRRHQAHGLRGPKLSS